MGPSRHNSYAGELLIAIILFAGVLFLIEPILAGIFIVGLIVLAFFQSDMFR